MVKKWGLQQEGFPLSYGMCLTRSVIMVEIHHPWTWILELLLPQDQSNTSLQLLEWCSAALILLMFRRQHQLPFGVMLPSRTYNIFFICECKFIGQFEKNNFCVCVCAASLSAIAIPQQKGNQLLSPNASIQKTKVVGSVVNGNSNIIV